MAWLRIDDGLAEHPKLLKLGGPTARWTWVEVLCYCARYKTKGIVPSSISDVVSRAKPAFISRCKEVGLLEETDEGWVVHDWDKYNPDDPTKAARQARWRARVDGRVDTNVDGAVDADVDNENVYRDGASRAGGRARPVPLRATTTAAAERREDQQPPAAAEDNLETALKNLNWNHGQRQAGHQEPERAMAWITKAQNVAQRNPGGYAWSGFDGGEWPTDTNHTQNGKPTKPLIEVLTTFVKGPGKEYNDEAILDEIGIHERKRNELLTNTQKTQLLELANQLRNGME